MVRQPSALIQRAEIDEKLRKAVDLHRSGQLERAEQIYREILCDAPKHADALHLLGVVAYQVGKCAVAVDLVSQAIEIDPKQSSYFNNLGNAFKKLGNLGESTQAYYRAIEIEPDYAEAYNNLGNVLAEQDRLEESISAYHSALEIDPEYSEAYNNLGVTLRAQGSLEKSVLAYRQAVQIDPEFANAYYNLGCLLQETGELEDSIRAYCKVLKINPEYMEVYNNLGLALRKQDRLEESVQVYRQAIEIKPDYVEAYNNLGNILAEQDRLAESIDAYRQALKINSDYSEAYNNLGSALQLNTDFKAAKRAYCKVLEMQPQFAAAHKNLGLLSLLMGDFQNGWKEYEWRWQCDDFAAERHRFPQPFWDGSSLNQKTILVWTEQGVGDEIMFSSMLPTLLKIDVGVIVECTRRLIPFFQRAFPGVRFIPRENPVNRQLLDMAIDCQIPMLSLGKWLRPSVESFPLDQESYLFSCVEKTKRLRQKYQLLAGGRLLVGISWKSIGSDRRRSRSKSTALESWTSILSRQDCFFLSLQYGDVEREIEEFKSKTDLRIYYDEEIDSLKNLDDFAAQVSALDLIISTSNTTVHVAGGLGKIVWTLLPNPPDWKWMLEGKDSVWYPAMRLFRQDKIGDWSGVFRSVALELDIFCRGMVSDESP